MTRPFVIVESPFGQAEAKNLVYLRQCLCDSYKRGEHPFASHAYYPFFLSETDPLQRQDGIELGYTFWDRAICVAFYVDLGFSPGMQAAYQRTLDQNKPIEIRTLGEMK